MTSIRSWDRLYIGEEDEVDGGFWAVDYILNLWVARIPSQGARGSGLGEKHHSTSYLM